MKKLIAEEWISLDGYVTDKDGSLDFFTQLSPEQNTYSDNDQLKFLDSVDVILLGRKTYELFVDFWPTASTAEEAIADKLNEIKKVVISNTLKHAPWGKWPEAEIISGNAIQSVAKLKSKPGKNIVLWGSISLVQSLMEANLIDEFHLQLCPIITGGGRNFFTGNINTDKLQLKEVKHYNTGTVLLNYQL